MGIIKQQTILLIIFAVSVTALILLFVYAISNSFELKKAREWSQHSETVSEQIRKTNQLFRDADFCGRLIINRINNCNVTDKRKIVFEEIEVLRSMVIDSQAQSENVTDLFNSVQSRFQLQDQIQNLSVSEDRFTITTEQSLLMIDASVLVDRSFNNLESQEFAYLKSRHQNLQRSEYKFNQAVYLFSSLAFIGIVSFGWFGNRTLIRAKRVNSKLRDQLENQTQSNNEIVVLKRSEYDELRAILRGDL